MKANMGARYSVLGSVFLSIAGGLLLFAMVHDSGTPPPDAKLSLTARSAEKTALPYQPDTSRLRFAVAPVLSPSTTLHHYEALASYLGQHLGRPVDVVLGKSYAETNALVRSGDVSLALVCSGAYVVGRSDFGMELLVVPVVKGESTYHSYLIVSAPSTARSWDDLRGKTFAFTDPLSNSGRLVPLYVLSQMGETPESFFRAFIFTYSHDNSIRAVADGLVDAAAVDSLVYDAMVQNSPSLAAKTKVIWKSPPYGINPIVVHPSLDPELRHQLMSILLDMSENPEGRGILAELGIDTFVPPDPRDYDTIEEMLTATASR